MKTLLHICCAPCSITCIDTLRQEGIEPVGFWYNPNIHPFTEYKMRKNTLVEYAKSIDLKLEIENEYGLRRFIQGVYPDFDHRCGFCYALRFEETARYAAEHGFDQFTSTLFVSPYQNHELMRETCERMAEKYGVKYLHRDFSPRFREGQDKARELGLYMQKYCGVHLLRGGPLQEKAQKAENAPNGVKPAPDFRSALLAAARCGILIVYANTLPGGTQMKLSKALPVAAGGAVRARRGPARAACAQRL